MARLSAPSLAAVLTVVATTGAVVAVVVATRPDADAPAAGGGGWLPGVPPASYRIVYDVTSRTGRGEIVEVTPTRTRKVTTRNGAPAGGTALAEDGLYVRGSAGWTETQVALPGDPGDAMVLRTALASAEPRGLARRDGTGTVAGRECTWWVTNVPFDGGPLAAATASSRARSCVDRVGLVLADSWVADGKVVRSRRATEVTLTADLAGSRLFDDVTPKPLLARLRTTVVSPRAKPVVAAPPGLVAERSVDAVEPGRRRARTVFRGGGDAAVVTDATGSSSLGTGTAVDVGVLGTAVLRSTLGGIVVEVLRPNGHVLQVRTSLAEDVVLRWLRSL